MHRQLIGVTMAVCDYQYDEDKRRIRINCLGCMYGSSIEDFPQCMASVIDKILEVKDVAEVVLAGTREYDYDYNQTKMLVEIANVIDFILREKLLSVGVSEKCRRVYPEWNSRLNYIVLELMRRDPVGAYVEILREIRFIKVKMKRAKTREYQRCFEHFLEDVLYVMKEKLEGTKLIKIAKPHISGYHMGDRTLYRQIFTPNVRPNFMLTKYMITPPENAKSVDRYRVGDTKIEIFRLTESAENFYHALPPEFMLPEEKYTVLDMARRYMAAHRPRAAEFVRSEKVREVFYNIGRDMVREMAEQSGVSLSNRELDQLASILTRYTAGLGVLEILLTDEKVQDIYINSPVERQPILIYHQDWEECKTNLIPTKEDAEAWATRLRIQSGRPLDEANPVLDTDVAIPGGKARFAVITRTLSPDGLGFAIRRHRDSPWTLPLFIKNRMLSPLAAGLLSFLIDGSVSMLVAGGRSAGKTSVLSAMMLEILPKVRIVTIEDSVTGDAEIVYQNGGEMKTGTVGQLVDEMIEKYESETLLGRDILASNPKKVKVFAVNKNGKVVLAPVSRFIRHKIEKDMYIIKTATGRDIKVTCDHSLFTLGRNGDIVPVKAKDIEVGSFLATPRILRFGNRHAGHINLINHLEKIKDFYITGKGIRKFIKENWNYLKVLGNKTGYSRSMISYWKKNNIIPAKIMMKVRNANKKVEFSHMKIKARVQSKPIPAEISLDKDFLSFIGLWLADGCYDKNSVILSVSSKEERNICKKIAKRFRLATKIHSDGFSIMINSVVLKKVMEDVLELKGNSYTKRIPPWVHRLSMKQISWVLKGLFSGDGCVSDKEIILSVCSKGMLRDVQTLLLGHGIILRIGGLKKRDRTWRSSISSLKSLKLFKNSIGFLQRFKKERLEKICSKTSTHDSSDIVPLSYSLKLKLAKVCNGFNIHDYITHGNNIGREKLKRLLKEIPESESGLRETISKLANSDIYWDKVKEVKHYRKPCYVYDFSVPGYENFICNNILAHNTLELPVNQLRELNYNVESLKSRSVITRVETEMPADEALRTALRLGDSALIVGEVRSVEAKALYEAMRIGALSNVVAGTIHGESAYGVYDRVVNDLGVPPTSFKATDIIPICKSLRSADGLHRFRRITEITEVRKEWSKDPLKEGGFVYLMEYSGKEDKLKPTDTFVNGESEILNRISSYVKEWAGNWDAVWKNINLRGKIKQTMIEVSEKLKKPELIEAEWVVKSNAKFHLISENVRNETGATDPKRVYIEWLKWFKAAARKA